MMLFASGNAPRKIEEKWSFLLYFARFALSLMLRIQGTHVREYKRKMCFLFVFYSLSRTFAKRKTNKQRYGRNQKTVYCFHSLSLIMWRSLKKGSHDLHYP